jgi:hypothetical protein
VGTLFDSTCPGLIDYAPGFAFVEMATDEEAQKAAAEFNQFQMGGRGRRREPTVINR